MIPVKRARRSQWTSRGRPLDVPRTSARSMVLRMEGTNTAFQESHWTQVPAAEPKLRSGLRWEVRSEEAHHQVPGLWELDVLARLGLADPALYCCHSSAGGSLAV